MSEDEIISLFAPSMKRLGMLQTSIKLLGLINILSAILMTTLVILLNNPLIFFVYLGIYVISITLTIVQGYKIISQSRCPSCQSRIMLTSIRHLPLHCPSCSCHLRHD